MSGAGPVKKPSVGNPSKKATASRDSGRSNIHSGHKSLSRSLKTSDKDALHEDPRTRLTEFPSIAEEPASCSSPSMFSKLFGSGGGEVKRDGTKRQVEPARTNSVDSVSRNASGAEDAKAKKAVTNESGSSVSSLQRNTSVRRHSDAEESLRSIKGKNDRAIDAVLSKAFEANKEILSGESSRPPLSHRLHTPKRVHSSHWTEVTESTAEHYKVRQLLERTLAFRGAKFSLDQALMDQKRMDAMLLKL
ncbi:hypothetical protein A7U60_g5884 [Sanghuangporus baumii]|uniref:Uncharacterized protein n=1 Tax=Sanghuangporus baumii TaxID=108892 RepID=A0A9Q5HW06_SANBA|nr:hypothetical protein A7U60_g5884 [Sanghuangporus baumii]